MIAWLLDQEAAPRVDAIMQKADAGNLQLLMSWINVGEVYYIAAKRYGREKAERFLERLLCWPV